MNRCFSLARQGKGKVAPNPLVGCVILKDGKVVGEGYHKAYGKAHAEVNAIESVTDPNDLKGATLFVNLEPCSHFGKTPPCTDRIIESGIREVYISSQDPSEKVNGKGIAKLRGAGIKVHTGILKEEEEELNRRFRTYHLQQRPYIILKWAQSKDGFMDVDRAAGQMGQFMISNEASQRLLHLWRSEEGAILVGSQTYLIDNPSLNVRNVVGESPLRIVPDLSNKLPLDLNVFVDGGKTLYLHGKEGKSRKNVENLMIHDRNQMLEDLLDHLFRKGIQSLLVEGGSKMLQSFLNRGMWDEIRLFVNPNLTLESGLKAPNPGMNWTKEFEVGDNLCRIYRNKK